MSVSALRIHAAHTAYRLAIGSDEEHEAYRHLKDVVRDVQCNEGGQPQMCCGGRCRWCDEWRVP